jgi:hypothetical protein
LLAGSAVVEPAFSTLACIRWIVGRETPANSANIFWSIPSNDRAALIGRRDHERGHNTCEMIIELAGGYNDVKTSNVDSPAPREAASAHAVANHHDPLPKDHGLPAAPTPRRDARR